MSYPAPLTSGCLAHLASLTSTSRLALDQAPSPPPTTAPTAPYDIPPLPSARIYCLRPRSSSVSVPVTTPLKPTTIGTKTTTMRKGAAVGVGPAPERRPSSDPRLLRATPLPAPPRRAASDCRRLCGRQCCYSGGWGWGPWGWGSHRVLVEGMVRRRRI